MSDTLYITCHICGKVIRENRGPDGAVLSALQAIAFHQSVIAHIAKAHMRSVPA